MKGLAYLKKSGCLKQTNPGKELLKLDGKPKIKQCSFGYPSTKSSFLSLNASEGINLQNKMHNFTC